jgi:hypothetical protein
VYCRRGAVRWFLPRRDTPLHHGVSSCGRSCLPREAGKTTHAFAMLLLERKRNSRVIEPSRRWAQRVGWRSRDGLADSGQAVIDELSRPPGMITDLAEAQRVRPRRASSQAARDSSPLSAR